MACTCLFGSVLVCVGGVLVLVGVCVLFVFESVLVFLFS